MKGRK